MLKQAIPPSRRLTARIRTPEGVWVYWRCNGRDETPRVRDLSLGGLFLETAETKTVGSTAKLDFLVQEGQIRAEAVVRRIDHGGGLGLKFTAVQDQDRLHLAQLLNRVRGLCR